MLHFARLAVARLRLAQGRCPACASELPDDCGVCRGHRAPFPVDAGTLRRWEARFEAGMVIPPVSPAPLHDARWHAPSPAGSSSTR